MIYKCKCAEEYDFEGWNVNSENGPGNAYHIISSGGYRVKYTTCTKCKERVVLSREKWLSTAQEEKNGSK